MMGVKQDTAATRIGLLFCFLCAGLLVGCSDEERTPDALGTLARVKSELAVGRREAAYLQHEELAALLRDLRTLHARLVQQGEGRRAREVMKAIRDLEIQCARLRTVK